MVSDDVKAQAKAWDKALQTWVEPAISDLARIVFGLSSDLDRLEKMGIGQYGKGKSLGEKKDACLSLLTSSLITNGMTTIYDLEVTPLVLVSVIQKMTSNGR